MKKTLTLVIILILIHGGIMAKEETKQEVKKMLQDPENIQTIHQFFSAGCFNKTWEYLDKKELSQEDIENMIVCSNTSLYHWKKRNDCTADNLSIAYWQLARVYTVADKLEMAKDYAEKCLNISLDNELEPFYIGYGYEAISRTMLKMEKLKKCRQYLNKGYEELEKVNDKDSKKYLSSDLDDIKKKLNN